MKKKTTKTTKKTAHIATQLDDNRSALVLAEYLVLGDVHESEISAILDENRGATVREMAVTFRISEVLGLPDAFAMSPKFATVFANLRTALRGAA